MDKFRHNTSNITTTTHSSSQPGGKKQVYRRSKLPSWSSDSSSCGSGSVEEEPSSFTLGQRSSKQQCVTPMKKLLDEEMSRETASKRRAPSVIARLMGLDGLPLQQPADKQHKGSSENNIRRTKQVEKTRSSGTLYDGISSRRSSKDQQEFKDVFEVSEIPKAESSRYSSQRSADLKITDAEMSFIEQKFMVVKRLATDSDLQSSKEFHDALEVLDSNTDLLLKYFQRPDSLFKKHLNDLQVAPLQSHCSLIEAMKSSEVGNYEHGDFNWKSGRDAERLNYHMSHQKYYHGYPRYFDRRHTHSSPISSKLQLKGKDEPGAVPTSIVVLKPNLGKVQNATKIVSSPCSSHTFLSERRERTNFPDVRNRDVELHQKKNLPDTVRLSRQNSMESREIANEITRQMKSSLNSSSMIFSSSRFRGYAGDDSSCNFFGNESPEESEITAATLGNCFDLNNCSGPSSRSSESFVSREAKKRLSERWKTAHKSQQVQAISGGSTLAEMLAVSDKEMKEENFNSMSGGEAFHDKFASNGIPAGWVKPLGISSRDGWKDGCIGSLSRSKSLPASSTAFGSHRTILRHEALLDDRFMMPKETLKQERKKAAMDLDRRQAINPGSSKSGHKKSWSSHYTNMESNKVKVSESLAETLINTSAVTADVVDVTHENAAGSSEPTDELLPELSSCALIKGDIGTVEKDILNQQELSVGSSSGSLVSFQTPTPGSESSCCKDADQPSPVSVLEPSFTDDLSSCSECFESLSADLQGLRMQLQLLKSESEDYAEGPMLNSSEEDGGEASIGISEENGLCRTEDSWESSYIIDVLSEYGIDGAHLDTFLEVWHSPECPVSPSVFDELEKRYSDWTTCPRSERRLLFDRINSGLVKINQQFMQAQPWTNPAITNIGSKLIKKRLQDRLCKLLGRQGKVKDDALGKVLARESQWLEVRDDIDVIGEEVERLLLDDLVAEIAGK